MVQLIKTGKVSPESQLQRDKMASVKVEDNDFLEEQHSPLNKRSKLSTSLPQPHNLGFDGSPVSTSQFNPLEEPSPLGLRLKKSPSLLDLIQMKLSQGNASKVRLHSKKEAVASSCTIDKLKASNFPASLLRIGTWEYKSKYEGDLVAKCYFAKHKLVWEVLDGGLKNKIEIQWSDIMALKANYSDVGPESLDVVLARQPLFFRETNPQPRKHTLWHSTSDFTGGQASVHRRHYMECPQGLLAKHFEKLIQCDPRLNYLSQQAEITLVSPYFDPGVSGVDDSNELNSGYDFDGGPSIFDLHDAASPSGTQSSSSKNEQHEFIGRPLEHFSRETPSPSSVTDTSVIEEIRSHGALENCLSSWDQIKVPGIHHSMSMSDLVSHIENQISEHRTLDNPNLSNEGRQSLVMLEEISRWLFTDFPPASTSDENSVMSRVDSLCCLLQKDPVTFPDLPVKSENGDGEKMEEDISTSEGNCGAEDSPTH